MPKQPRDKESVTSRKRTRKTTPKPENGVHADGNGASTQPVAVSPEAASSQVACKGNPKSNVEEQIRIRAYQLYLERGGNGGSPEQDWFRAQEEICGRGSAA